MSEKDDRFKRDYDLKPSSRDSYRDRYNRRRGEVAVTAGSRSSKLE